MTPEELNELKELAGLNEKSNIENQKEWANKQLTNQPKIENQLPIPNLKQFGLSEIKLETFDASADKELENLASRLNNSLGNKFMSDIKIERLL